MKNILIVTCCIIFLSGSVMCQKQVSSNQLRIGDPAPNIFLMRTTDEKRVSLDEILKDGPVLLAFFPFAFSPD